MKILYTTARFPYPPLRGDQLVPYARIQHLARKHEITLLSFVEGPEEMEYVRHLKPHCVEVHTVPLPRWRSYASMSGGALSSLPMQVLYYSSREYQRKLQEILANGKFDAVHTVLSRPANHTIHIEGVVKVCEMIDAVSLTMERRARATRWPVQSVWRMEAKRMRRFEQCICKSFDGVVVVSEVDRQELNAPNVTVVPVGADVDPRPRPAPNGHKVVIFTGNFAYHSNQDAAIFLINEIWPQLRQAIPGTRLRIVGNGPSPTLLRAARQFPEVEVTGFVPDLRQHLFEADVAVAPMRLGGGGMHCKAIEAMACGTPLVVSSRVTRGVEGRPGEDFLLAGDAPEYVRAIRSIFENPGLATALSDKGRRLVAEKYSWEKTTQRLELLYEELLHRRSESNNHAHRN
ncbi:MAG TPA: glycosyltransferase family 4 protein [Candidatus Acidoferrum sp.]|nr:glycosyltransferase family 4 protein [Candidatus Acidoferrum sp.]